ncbi:MAG: pilus assembly protein PilM [Candidatus Riflebacteria bacterium]|nr:pilus assembly protein PilM [Candidatus Riflebacteria bacterium]
MAGNETQKEQEEFFAIDIGTYALKCAFVQYKADGTPELKTLAQFVLPNFELAIPPEEKELLDREQTKERCLKDLRQFLTTKVTELLYDNQIQTKTAVLCASSKDVTIRCLTIDPTPDELQRTQAIQAESHKQMPFSVNNAILGWNLEGSIKQQINEEEIPPGTAHQAKDGETQKSPEKEMTQVMVGALQRDALEEIQKHLSGAGLSCAGILVLPQVLHLSFGRQIDSFSALGKNLALVHMGHSSTSVIIFKNSKVQFYRDINMAGAEITNAVYEGLVENGAPSGEETYNKATFLKHSIGIIPPDDIEQMQGEEKIAAEKIFDSIEKIFQNIQLSISFYIAQNNEHKIDAIILSGGSAVMKNFKTFIEEITETPTHFAEPFNDELAIGNIKYDIGKMQEDAAALASLIGVALYQRSSTIINFIEILNPNKKALKKESQLGASVTVAISNLTSKLFTMSDRKVKIVTMLATILIVLLLLSPTIYILGKEKKINADIKKTSKELRTLRSSESEVSAILDKIKQTEALRGLETSLNALKYNNSEMLMEIASLTPATIFYTSANFNISPQKANVRLSGHSNSSDNVFLLISSLEKSDFFNSAKLESVNEEIIDESRYYIKFSMTAEMDMNAFTNASPQSSSGNLDEFDDFSEEDW